MYFYKVRMLLKMIYFELRGRIMGRFLDLLLQSNKYNPLKSNKQTILGKRDKNDDRTFN